MHAFPSVHNLIHIFVIDLFIFVKGSSCREIYHHIARPPFLWCSSLGIPRQARLWSICTSFNGPDVWCQAARLWLCCRKGHAENVSAAAWWEGLAVGNCAADNESMPWTMHYQHPIPQHSVQYISAYACKPMERVCEGSRFAYLLLC